MNRARDVLAQSVDLALEATVVLSFSKVGYQVRRRVFDWTDVSGALDGRVVVVTGATSGLGRALARRLARLGATLVVTGRDVERTRRARAELVAETANPAIQDRAADLGRLDQVVTLAERIRDDHGRLDALVHNAGALVHDHRRTPDGLELTVQTHVVAPFLLTCLLLDRLAETPDSRVVTVTSGGLYTQRLGDLDADLDPRPDQFDGVVAYARAKRAQVVLTREWARRAAGPRGRLPRGAPGLGGHAGAGRGPPRVPPADGPVASHPRPGRRHHRLVGRGPRSDPPPGGHLWLDRHHRWSDKVPWTVTSASTADGLWHWVSDRADLGTLRVSI